MSVAVCMIVKNELATLETCLSSVRPHVDEVCIYDTGSTDGTLDLLERLASEDGGAPIVVVWGEWRDSFAWARQQSFDMASSDWQMYLDADDEVCGGENLAALAALAETRGADVVEALYDCWDMPGGGVHHTWRERLVRRGSGKWGERVHELYRVPHTSETLIAHPGAFYVRHTARGRLDEESTARRAGEGKTKDYYRQKYLDAIEHPEDSPRALFLFGLTLMGDGDHRGAASAFERYLSRRLDAIEGPWNVMRALALQHIVKCYAQLGEHGRGADWAKRALAYQAGMQAAEARGEIDPMSGTRITEFGNEWLKTREPSAALTVEHA
jgi:glycosyltransferase involved in cell wall biosynthesis